MKTLVTALTVFTLSACSFYSEQASAADTFATKVVSRCQGFVDYKGQRIVHDLVQTSVEGNTLTLEASHNSSDDEFRIGFKAVFYKKASSELVLSNSQIVDLESDTRVSSNFDNAPYGLLTLEVGNLQHLLVCWVETQAS